MNRVAILAICALTFVLSGCAQNVFKVSSSELAKMPPEKAAAFLVDKTIRTYSADYTIYVPGPFGGSSHFVRGHGTQVEYFGRNGRAYLWYQGNRRPVPAFWKVELNDKYAHDVHQQICFKYPSRSYNPSTGAYGGNWECRSLSGFFRVLVEEADGDIFDLSSGRLPFVMAKKHFEFNDLLRMAGRPLLKAPAAKAAK